MKAKKILASIAAAAVVTSTAVLPSGIASNAAGAELYPTVDNTLTDKLVENGRKISGYFASWRANELGSYFTYKDLPWGKMTTINYAFGSVGNWGDGTTAHKFKLKAGGESTYDISGMTPEEAVDYLNSTFVMRDTQPQLAAPPNFECWVSDSDRATIETLVDYKNHVSPKTRIVLSVGGWASSGEFYPMLDAGQAAWDEFADTAVALCDELGLDGIDMDFEHPSTMGTATEAGLCGNPQNFDLAEKGMNDISTYQNYVKFMENLNKKLDAAGKGYTLSAAGSASGWVLRGEALSEYCRTLDYINLMSYDLNGAWNEFVWHQAPLYSDTHVDGQDESTAESRNPEIIYASPKHYDALGGASNPRYAALGTQKDKWTPDGWFTNYLTVDWAVKYYEGAMPSEKINIGVPYYTRGWMQVDSENSIPNLPAYDKNDSSKGHLGGTTPQISATSGGGVLVSQGADALDGLWNDPQPDQPAGANSLYQMRNLLDGKVTSFSKAILKNTWGRTDEDIALIVADVEKNHREGRGYKLYRDEASGNMPYIWNEATRTFITFEDTTSLATKMQYVIDKNLGGFMTWEFSGDYDWDENRQEWVRGSTMTSTAAKILADAPPLVKSQPKADSELADFTWYSGTSNYLAYSFSSGIQIANAASVWNSAGPNVIEFDFSDTNPNKVTSFNSYQTERYTSSMLPWTFSRNSDGTWHARASITTDWAGLTLDNAQAPVTPSSAGYGGSKLSIAIPAANSVALPLPFAIKNFQVNGKYSRSEFTNNVDEGRPSDLEPSDPNWDTDKINIADAYLDGVPFAFTETGEEITPVPAVYINRTYKADDGNGAPVIENLGTKLVAGEDFDLEYENNIDVSTPGNYATVFVIGKGDYTGTALKTFFIVEGEVPPYEGELEPPIDGDDRISIIGADVTGIEDSYDYTGSAIVPEITVTLEGTVLTDEDYTVSYSPNNIDAGTVTVTIRGTGDYKDSITETFEIIDDSGDERISIIGADVTGLQDSYIHSGSEIVPEITVSLDGTVLVEGEDYTVSYAPNTVDIGTVTVTITGTGDYKDSITETFEIVNGVRDALKGDYDRDGEIILRYDLLILKRALNDDPTVESIDTLIDVGDLNADGNITMSEVTDFKRHDVEYSGYEDLNEYYRVMDELNNAS